MNNNLNNVFIGFDSKEEIASLICEYSIKKYSKNKIKINHLKLEELRKKGLYKRTHDNLSSTEFTFSRFLVPFLMNYEGWAVFCDSDFLWIDDINKLFSLKDNKFAVMCVHHEYEPKNIQKKIGAKQLLYPRKNWSSMVLWNCGHPSNKKVNLELVNNETGKYLHRFGWLKNNEIGQIGIEWNWLVGWYDNEKIKPKAIHFTEGGPWLNDNYKTNKYAELWLKMEREFKS